MQQGDIFISQSDILSLDDGLANEIMAKVKENYVQNNHPYAISYLENKGYWKTYVGNPRKGVTRKTKEVLIDFLYKYYKQEESTVEEIFAQVKVYRRNVLNRNPNTIRKYDYSFERFASKDLMKSRVTSIDEEYLDQHFTKIVKKFHPTDKALKEYKTVLSSIFEYAFMKKMIPYNPVKWINLDNYFKDCTHSTKCAQEHIFTQDEINTIKKYTRESIAKKGYAPVEYAILLSIETGMRVGKIPPLRWTDIDNDLIHIYRQQVQVKVRGGHQSFEFVDYTKNERKHPKGGRYFPITEEIATILNDIKAMQKEYKVKSEYIFCDTKGNPIKKSSISGQIERINTKLGFHITNNHAFRKSLNSNVLIPAGFTVAERAYLLGHSVETNQRHYSFVREESLELIRNRLNALSSDSIHSHSLKNVVDFPKEKSLTNPVFAREFF